MSFIQRAPELGNQFDDDAFFRETLERVLPAATYAAITPELSELGKLAGGELYQLFLSDPTAAPKLVAYSPWGVRTDQIELTALWKRAAVVAAEFGVVAAAYDPAYGANARIHQMALTYLFEPSTGVFSCPLAMTDGAARTLIRSGNTALRDRAVPRLTSRDPLQMWTSGQWMTERIGGSDVSCTETRAVPQPDGSFKLYGTKWFTSATTSQMALTLARPEMADGSGAGGGKGLALFYVETREESGLMNGIGINRLKDKLGTRMVPTAELTLEGTRASAVCGTQDGVKHITPMLTVTRTWNAVCAVAGMRRAVALATSYARARVAFGSPLIEKALHRETLADMTCESMGAFALTFRMVALLGLDEANVASEHERALLRLLTPIVKLTTGKQAVAIASEATECFGGAGYIEDTGLPKLLRDAQVLPIWEGTTNVLSLDFLRALGRGGDFGALHTEVTRATQNAPVELGAAVSEVHASIAKIEAHIIASMTLGQDAVNTEARRIALSVGRTLEAAYLIEHATWEKATQRTPRASAGAARLVRRGINLLHESTSQDEASLLLGA